MTSYSHYFLNTVRPNNRTPQQVYNQHFKLVQAYQASRLKNMKFALDLIDQKIRETRVYTEDPVQQESIRQTVNLLLDMDRQIRRHIVGNSMDFLQALEKVLQYRP